MNLQYRQNDKVFLIFPKKEEQETSFKHNKTKNTPKRWAIIRVEGMLLCSTFWKKVDNFPHMHAKEELRKIFLACNLTIDDEQ